MRFKVSIEGRLAKTGKVVREVCLEDVEAVGNGKAKDYAKARCQPQLARFLAVGRRFIVERLYGEPEIKAELLRFNEELAQFEAMAAIDASLQERYKYIKNRIMTLKELLS